jgi:hypothetical protein
LNAPEMWMDDVEDFYYTKGEILFKDIAQNTNFPLLLFINGSASKYTRWKAFLKSNPNIEIRYFNSTPVEGFKFLIRFFFKKQWGMPRSHNVLIPSVMIALQLKFKTILLAGADHNWLKDISVSKDNTVFLTQKHFYDQNTAEKRPMDKFGKGQRRLDEILYKFAVSLSGYFTIQEYSEKNGAEIINLTPDSFIDAFKKMSIEEYLKEK